MQSFYMLLKILAYSVSQLIATIRGIMASESGSWPSKGWWICFKAFWESSFWDYRWVAIDLSFALFSPIDFSISHISLFSLQLISLCQPSHSVGHEHSAVLFYSERVRVLWASFCSVQGNIHMHKCLAVDEEILCAQICLWNLQPSTEPCIRQAVHSDRRAWITASETFSGSVVFVVGAMDLPHAPSPQRYSAEPFIQKPERFLYYYYYYFFFLHILDWKPFLLCSTPFVLLGTFNLVHLVLHAGKNM